MTSPGKPAGSRLLHLSAWRYARQHPWQTWLSFLGIALGVMMVVAVDLANSSARRAFALSVEAVNGNITHQIVGGSAGVPDAVFTALRTDLGIRRSAPSLSAGIRIDGQQLTLMGLDLISEASLQRRRPGLSTEPYELLALGFAALASTDAVLMSSATAASLGLMRDERFTLLGSAGMQEAVLAATFDSDQAAATDNLVFADIATAQQLLRQPGYIDSIDLILDASDAQAIRNWLPPGLRLIEMEGRNASLEQMTSAFHVNLLAMSLLALLVAGLLIYNTVSLSVLQRRQSMGIMRSLGVSRFELIRLILREAFVLGLLASIAGVLLGLVLGQGLVQLVTRTIDDLYFDLTVTRFLFDPLVPAKGLLWGTGLTLLAAALPAWQAGQSEPVTLQQRSLRDQTWQQRLPLIAVGGVVLLMAGYVLLLPASGSLVLGFIALNLIIFGYCLIVPLGMHQLVRGILCLCGTRLRQTQRLALRNIQTGISRTGLAVAALAVAVSVTVGVGVMVGSFRQTVILWLEQTLAGDLQVSRLDEPAMPQTILDLVMTTPDVDSVSLGFSQRVESEYGEVQIMASSTGIAASLFIKALPDELVPAVEQGDGVLVSEPFAYRHQLAIGDMLTLYPGQGALRLPIMGIFYDYTTGPGMVALAQPLFASLWPEQRGERLTLHLASGADAGAVASRLRQMLSEQPGTYGLVANADIRAITLRIFDRTFAITHVLRLLAIVVAFVGVLSALIALQLERMREYAMLRATGMTVGQVVSMIGSQTLVMGSIAGLLALPLGLMMADILIDVINRRSFGWSMLHRVEAGVLVEAVLLALAAALLAGIYPAMRVAAVRPADALRQE